MREDMSTMVCVKEDEDPSGEDRMCQEEIISRTRQVIQGLDALKQEHHSILDGVLGTLRCLKQEEQGVLVEEKSLLVRKSLDMLELGLSEAQVMMALSGHLSSVESEKQKLRAQVRRLVQENQWLRDELANTQQKLQKSEQSVAQLEEEKKHLEFMNQLKKYDQDLSPSEEKDADSSKESLDDLFPDEQDDQSPGTLVLSPVVSLVMGKQKDGSPFGEYGGWYKACKVDSPTVTTTLKNLGALYKRQGKFEAAETLEEVALRSRKQGLDGVPKQRVAEVLSDPEAREKQSSRESLTSDSVKYETGPDGGQEVSMSVEWNGDGSGALKRSGSFGKLRASIRRSSEKLVRKLKGGGSGRDSEPKNPGLGNYPQYPASTLGNYPQYPASTLGNYPSTLPPPWYPASTLGNYPQYPASTLGNYPQYPASSLGNYPQYPASTLGNYPQYPASSLGYYPSTLPPAWYPASTLGNYPQYPASSLGYCRTMQGCSLLELHWAPKRWS
ncbi:unnamed protein product [Arctogadus glacialis]